MVKLMSSRCSTTARISEKKVSADGTRRSAQQLRELTGGHGETDPDLDPDERGLGDVVDQRADAEQPGHEQDDADQDGEHREGAADPTHRRRCPRRRASTR